VIGVGRVAVAMSGGVDSSVAAALLVEQGQEVFGIMLRLWSQSPAHTNRCCSPADMARARAVAAKLDIPFYVLDVQDLFKRQVVDFFIDGYAQGFTPNPCMECNRHIRWDFLLNQALAYGATHLATGHYARVRATSSGYQLLRAEDNHKDQSYVLSIMGQAQLGHAIFPLGDYTKPQVRQLAQDFNLESADKPDSQDLCFIGDMDYRTFLQAQGQFEHPGGPIVDVDGSELGVHSGLANYTIGQRKGIGLSAPRPLYVIEKDLSRNRLIVGPRTALGRDRFEVSNVNWVSGVAPEQPVEVAVRVRYKAREVAGLVTPLDRANASVVLAEDLPDVTPGQSAVFYQGDVCLGGGVIRP
jgi:tRNA-specific 2-thiouridylase